jgi:hypothetical protein
MRLHLPRFYYYNTLLYLFCHLMIHDLANMTCKLPEDGVLTLKHVAVMLI